MDLRYLAILLVTIYVGYAAKPRQFSLTATNTVKEPQFNASMTMTITCRKKTLVRYMEEAVLKNQTWRSFDGKFTAPYGYYVNSINGVVADWDVDQTYWSSWNGGAYLQKGIYEYIPAAGDQILFKIVDGSDTTHT